MLVLETSKVLSALKPREMPVGYSTEAKHLVKPVGDTQQPLVLLSSYPTFTTVHPDFRTTDDLSNPSIRTLYSKLGLNHPRAPSGVLHIDMTILRVDRPVAEAAYGSYFHGTSEPDSELLPRSLRSAWDDFQYDLLDKSEANVGLLVGQSCLRLLTQYLDSRQLKRQFIYETGATTLTHYSCDPFPVAVKEFTTDVYGLRLKRIWFATYHPEHYLRGKAYVPSNMDWLYVSAFRERLIDVAYLIAYGLPPPLPAYLSTTLYFSDSTYGTIIPRDTLEALDTTDKVAVAKLFAKPDCRLIERLKEYLECSRSTALSDKADAIYNAAISACKVSKTSPQYWSSASVRLQHGPYATLYSLMWERK